MKTEQLLQDYNIDVARPSDENYRPGWLNVQCPFCADHSRHLGIRRSGNYANCWRCGWHPFDETIAELLRISRPKARSIIKKYKGNPFLGADDSSADEVVTIRKKSFKFPTDTGALKVQHRKYLKKRGFNSNHLESVWGLRGTGPISKLDKSEYKHRIIAPIIWDGDVVSFQGRAIAPSQKPKYKACPKDRELIEHQKILYGNQEAWGDRFGVIVEGITDVWRLGELAAATFGIDWTHYQARQIAKHFDRVVILFDNEPQAQKQAEKLKHELINKPNGPATFIHTINSDPGDLTQDEADDLIENFLNLYNTVGR